MCKLSVNCIGYIATNDRVFSELWIGKKCKRNRQCLLWKLRPAHHLCQETQRSQTQHDLVSGLGTGDLRIQNGNNEHSTVTFRLHSWHTGLLEQQLETRTWLCVLTEVEMSACWSRGSVAQWCQPAFVKECKFPFLMFMGPCFVIIF